MPEQTSVPNEPIQPAPKKISRRELLFGAKKRNRESPLNSTSLDTQPSTSSQQELIESIADSPDEVQQIESFFQRLYQKADTVKISRRTAIKTLGGVGGATTIDHFLLRGRGRKYLWQFITNPDFRNKLVDSISTGELFEEDIPNLIEDIVGAPDYSAELGETLNLNESWLDNTFDHYQVRQLLEDGQNNNHLVLIADINHTDLVTGTAPDQKPNSQITDFPKTASQIDHDFVVLPQTQKSKADWLFDDFDYSQLTPRMYSAYQTPEGVVEFFEDDGQKRNRGGALVLIDNQVQVVDTKEVDRYQVGTNCQVIEVCAFCINSDNLEQDLEGVDTADTYSGVSPNQARYASLVATFSKDGQPHTKIISIYNHHNEDNHKITGADWEDNSLLTVKQASELCQQISAEHNYDNFILAVPDSGELSALVSSETISDEQAQEFATQSNFPIDDNEYQPNFPHNRTLWETPYTQPTIPKYFLAASKH